MVLYFAKRVMSLRQSILSSTEASGLGGARHQVRRFLWLFGRAWTEAVLLPLKAVGRTNGT
jgi:hypothetical protein